MANWLIRAKPTKCKTLRIEVMPHTANPLIAIRHSDPYLDQRRARTSARTIQPLSPTSNHASNDSPTYLYSGSPTYLYSGSGAQISSCGSISSKTASWGPPEMAVHEAIPVVRVDRQVFAPREVNDRKPVAGVWHHSVRHDTIDLE